jgi:hypothetical protein
MTAEEGAPQVSSIASALCVADDDSTCDGDYVPEWLASFVRNADSTLLAEKLDFDRMADVTTTTTTSKSIDFENICSDANPSKHDNGHDEIEEDEVVFDLSRREDDVKMMPSLIDECSAEDSVQLSSTTSPAVEIRNTIDSITRNSSNIAVSSTPYNHLAVMDLLHSSPEMKERYGPKVSPASGSIIEYNRDNIASHVMSITSHDISEGEERIAESEDAKVWLVDVNDQINHEPPASAFDNPFVDESYRSDEEVEIDFVIPQSLSHLSAVEIQNSDNIATDDNNKISPMQEAGSPKHHLIDTSVELRGSIQTASIDRTKLKQQTSPANCISVTGSHVDGIIPELKLCITDVVHSVDVHTTQQISSVLVQNSYVNKRDKSNKLGDPVIHEHLQHKDSDNTNIRGSKRRLLQFVSDEGNSKTIAVDPTDVNIGSIEKNINKELNDDATDNNIEVKSIVANDTSDFFSTLLTQENHPLTTLQNKRQPDAVSSIQESKMQGLDFQSVNESQKEHTIETTVSSPEVNLTTSLSVVSVEVNETSALPMATLSNGMREDIQSVIKSNSTTNDSVNCNKGFSSTNNREDKKTFATSNFDSRRRAAMDVTNRSNDNLVKLEKEHSSGCKPPLSHSSPGTKEKTKHPNTGHDLRNENVPIATSLTPNRVDTLRRNEVEISSQHVSESVLHSSPDILLTHTLSESYENHVAPIYDCARSVGKFTNFCSYFSINQLFLYDS